jgi:trehalose-6-phosphate synthase
MKKIYIIWVIAVSLFAVAGATVQSTIEGIHLRNEADARASTFLSSLDDSLQTLHFGRVARIIDRLRKLKGPSDEVSSIEGLAVCGVTQVSFPLGAGWSSTCSNPAVARAFTTQQDQSWTTKVGKRHFKLYARVQTLSRPARKRVLVLIQDISAIRARWVDTFIRGFAVYWLSGFFIAFLIATQLRRWFKDQFKFFRHSIRSLIAGKIPNHPLGENHAVAIELQPLNRDIDELAKKIFILSNRQEKKKSESDSSWLSQLKNIMGSRKLVVIANREPYIHQKKEGKIQVQRPASGLVTALEPVLRQSGGLWIAHGSGNADRETSDENGIVGVPPGSEKYKLKRVWLSPEEEEGYYYGFSHTRPTFRLTDWKYDHEVNLKFCDAIPKKSLDEDSVILVQDYHFALLPQMIKERSKSPKIGLFWHIPWPNPEAFGLCPWNTELLCGMLGADVVGFHTQYHCNNFLETCNRYLEARIDYERFSVTMGNHETLVRAFPIGIDTSPVRTLSDIEIEDVKKKYGIYADKIAVGVDRLDYTKGLVERIEAVERFFEKNPEWIGRFSFVQMGSPSRTHIPAYQALATQLDQIIEKVNLRFSVPEIPNYKPVVLVSHHSWEDIQYFYQIGDVCLVTSLHDGMNLVAKEYVWCQSAHRGSLILSKFAGASRELTEAFIVNPYSIEEMADAISNALSLPEEERIARMQAMKAKVAGRNAFHWAADLIKAVVETEDPTQGLTTQSSPIEAFKRKTMRVI